MSPHRECSFTRFSFALHVTSSVHAAGRRQAAMTGDIRTVRAITVLPAMPPPLRGGQTPAWKYRESKISTDFSPRVNYHLSVVARLPGFGLLPDRRKLAVCAT